MASDRTVGDFLDELQPFVATWGVMTQNERERARRSATPAELQIFYDAMMPQLADILDYLNDYPLEAIEGDARTLMNLTLSLAEVAPHVEFYKGAPGVPFAFEEARFRALRADRVAL